jgi:hypothetical protein
VAERFVGVGCSLITSLGTRKTEKSLFGTGHLFEIGTIFSFCFEFREFIILLGIMELQTLFIRESAADPFYKKQII